FQGSPALLRGEMQKEGDLRLPEHLNPFGRKAFGEPRENQAGTRHVRTANDARQSAFVRQEIEEQSLLPQTDQGLDRQRLLLHAPLIDASASPPPGRPWSEPLRGAPRWRRRRDPR